MPLTPQSRIYEEKLARSRKKAEAKQKFANDKALRFSEPAPKQEPVKGSANRFGRNLRPGDKLGQDIIDGKSGPISESTGLGDFVNRLARNYTVDVGDATSRTIQDTLLGGKGKSNLLDYSLIKPTGNSFADGLIKYNPTNLVSGNFINNSDFNQMLAPGDFVGGGELLRGISKGVIKGVNKLAGSSKAKAALAGALASGVFGVANEDTADAAPTAAVKGATNLLGDALKAGRAIGMGIIPEGDRKPIWDAFQDVVRESAESNVDPRLYRTISTILSESQMTPKNISREVGEAFGELGADLSNFTRNASGGFATNGWSSSLREAARHAAEKLPQNVGDTAAVAASTAGIDPSIAIHLGQYGKRGLDIAYPVFDDLGEVFLAFDPPSRIAQRMDNAYNSGRNQYESIYGNLTGIDLQLPQVSTTLSKARQLRQTMDDAFGGLTPNAGRVEDAAKMRIKALSEALIRPGEHGIAKSNHAVESAVERLIDPSEELAAVRRLEAEFINDPNRNGEMAPWVFNALKAGYPIDAVAGVLRSAKGLTRQQADAMIEQALGSTMMGDSYRSIQRGFGEIRESAGVVSPLADIPKDKAASVLKNLDSTRQRIRRQDILSEEKDALISAAEREAVEQLRALHAQFKGIGRLI